MIESHPLAIGSTVRTLALGAGVVIGWTTPIALAHQALAQPSATSAVPQSAAATSHAAAYNTGIEDYRAERWEAAIAQFQVAASSPNDQLAAAARFNLGNAYLAKSLAAESSQASKLDANAGQKVIADLQNAMNAYKSSLRLAPNDTDARFNFEVVAKLLRQKQSDPDQPSQASDQQSGSPQQPEQQDSSSSPQDPSDSSPSGSDSSESDQEEPKQPNQQQPNQQQSDQQQSDQQQGGDPSPSSADQISSEENAAPNNPQRSGADTDNQSPEKNQGNPAGSKEQAQKTTSPPRDSQDSGSPAESQQPQPPGEPDSSSPDRQPVREGKLTSDQDDADRSVQPASQTGADPPEPAIGLTQQEAEKLLQSIRDRDLVRRLRLDAAKRRRRIPVPRDW